MITATENAGSLQLLSWALLAPTDTHEIIQEGTRVVVVPW
jgi:hypothetical protein